MTGRGSEKRTKNGKGKDEKWRVKKNCSSVAFYLTSQKANFLFRRPHVLPAN